MKSALGAVALALCVVALSCSSGVSPKETPGPASGANGDAAIVKIVSRDRTVTLSGHSGSLRATILDARGVLIARDVDVEALGQVDPASDDLVHGVWARVE
jgi:hypothetical protein